MTVMYGRDNKHDFYLFLTHHDIADTFFVMINEIPRVRGSDPILKYIQAIVFHVHKGVTMSDIYLDITFYQCHSWRGDTYIGTARLKPAEAGPGKVDYRWHYLEDHRVQSEWENLWRVINEQSPMGRDNYDLGQVLVRMVRHRDGSGSVARIRAAQAMKELAMLKHELEMLAEADEADMDKSKNDDDVEKKSFRRMLA